MANPVHVRVWLAVLVGACVGCAGTLWFVSLSNADHRRPSLIEEEGRWVDLDAVVRPGQGKPVHNHYRGSTRNGFMLHLFLSVKGRFLLRVESPHGGDYNYFGECVIAEDDVTIRAIDDHAPILRAGDVLRMGAGRMEVVAEDENILLTRVLPETR